jgi:hypothetical protein
MGFSPFPEQERNIKTRHIHTYRGGLGALRFSIPLSLGAFPKPSGFWKMFLIPSSFTGGK